MENSNEILNQLNSGNPELITTAIKEIQENGDLAIAEMLLKTLESPLDFYLTNTIVTLLADIKENQFREVLIQKLKSTSISAYKSLLLRIVWESSLNYSEYLELFQQLLRDEFAIALEASTVIENMIPQLTCEQRALLTSTLSTFPADKHFLTENIMEEIKLCNEEDTESENEHDHSQHIH